MFDINILQIILKDTLKSTLNLIATHAHSFADSQSSIYEGNFEGVFFSR